MAETFTGEVRGGVVVFEGSPPLPMGRRSGLSGWIGIGKRRGHLCLLNVLRQSLGPP